MDGLAPATVGNSSKPANGNYKKDDDLDFIVTWDDSVEVTGVPRIKIDLLSGTVYADYLSGTSTANLTFRYTVVATNYDPNGIVMNSPIELNGGTLKDSNGNDAELTYGLPNTSSVDVDGRVPVVTTVSEPLDGDYKQGDTLYFDVNFDKNITVTNSPRLTIDAGGTTVYANYFSGTGSSSIRFRYIVGAIEEDNNGISVTSLIDLNTTGILQDSFGNDALLTTPAFATSNITVDGVIPSFVGNAFPPVDGTYKDGEDLFFSVTYDEPVNVTNTPRISFDVGGTTRYADYVSGTGTATLNFQNTIVTDDEDTNGITMTTPLEFNGGNIEDLAGNTAPNLYSLPVTTGILIDAIHPLILSTGQIGDGTYIDGQTLTLSVTYDEAVYMTVANTYISVLVGLSVKNFDYVSGSGTTTHILLILFRLVMMTLME